MEVSRTSVIWDHVCAFVGLYGEDLEDMDVDVGVRLGQVGLSWHRKRENAIIEPQNLNSKFYPLAAFANES